MTPRPLLVSALLVTLALGAAGCGSDGEDETIVATVPTTTATAEAEPETKVQRLDTGDTKEAAGTVSVCGALAEMRRLQPAIRRFDDVSERLQSSTLGFPDGRGRPRLAFQERQRAESRDCDLYVAEHPAEVPGLAADGGLYDLAGAVEKWTAAPDAPALAPVRLGERVFALPIRAVPSSGVMVLSVHGRNPGGALVLLRALADARVVDD